MGCDATAAQRRIVVGVGRSPSSVAAVRWAAAEAALRGAILHAVHAWEPAARGRAPYAPGRPGADREADRTAASSLLATAVRTALGTEHQGAARGGADGHDGAQRAALMVEVAEGPPIQVLLRCARGADLLVLGGGPAAHDNPAHQPPDPVGPVARACLRAAPCPVVVVTQHPAADAGPARHRDLATAAAS
ncbi:MAG TPA: universal stress protein [Streptosporangiaceae bacterium]|nr:universal stress protein [Streptosporangiaceae bacterium]